MEPCIISTIKHIHSCGLAAVLYTQAARTQGASAVGQGPSGPSLVRSCSLALRTCCPTADIETIVQAQLWSAARPVSWSQRGSALLPSPSMRAAMGAKGNMCRSRAACPAGPSAASRSSCVAQGKTVICVDHWPPAQRGITALLIRFLLWAATMAATPCS